MKWFCKISNESSQAQKVIEGAGCNEELSPSRLLVIQKIIRRNPLNIKIVLSGNTIESDDHVFQELRVGNV